MLRSTSIALACAAVLAALFISGAALAVEQRAYALSGSVMMYERPDVASKGWAVEIPPDGVAVPSAVRDKSGELWLSAIIDGRSGWMHCAGIRLVMGPKSRFADASLKRLDALLAAIIGGKERGWEDIGASEGSDRTFTRSGGRINTISTPQGFRAGQFHATSGAACSQVLGFDPIGMKMDELRAKIGTPTARETPSEDRAATILTYECTTGGKALHVALRSDRVTGVEIY